MQGRITVEAAALCAAVLKYAGLEKWRDCMNVFLCILSVHSSLPLSSHSSSLRPLVYCLSYQPIHQWLLFFNKWRWLCPSGGWRIEAEWMQKCLFISFSLYSPLSPLCFHSLALILSFLHPPSHSVSGDWLAGFMLNGPPHFACSSLC